MDKKVIFVASIIFIVGLLFLSRWQANQNGPVGTRAASHTGQVAGAATTNTNPPSGSAQLAPDFSLQRLDGGTISLADYRGEKPVILDFWASWCHNCQRSMPKLSRMYDQYQDKVEVIGVNLRENNSAIQRFVDSRDISFPIALDPSGRTSNAYGVRFTNTHYLIDKEGKLVRTIPGDISESDVKWLVNL